MIFLNSDKIPQYLSCRQDNIEVFFTYLQDNILMISSCGQDGNGKLDWHGGSDDGYGFCRYGGIC